MNLYKLGKNKMLNSLKKFFFVVIFFYSISTSIFAQFAHTDLSSLGVGSRARALGGAFIGISDDPSASFWNPAGLISIKQLSVCLVIGYSSSFYKINEENIPDLNQSYGHLNYFSIIVPINILKNNLVTSISVQRVVDLYQSNENIVTYSENWFEKSTGEIYTLTSALAFFLNSKLSIGTSFNLWTGKEYENRYDYSGFNVSIGLMSHFNQLKFGSIIRLPFDLTFSGISKFSMPLMIGIGASFNPLNNLTFSFDYELNKFSNSKIKSSSYRYIINPIKYEDVNQIRSGIEYQYYINKTSSISLRVGFRVFPKPFVLNEVFPNERKVIGYVYSSGLGFKWEKLTLDFTIEYMRTTENWEIMKYKENYINSLLSITYTLR